MFEIDIREVREFEADLKTFASKAFPYATKATINTAAFETRKRYQENMRQELTLRNKWTAGSVRVEQARTLHVSRQESIVGSLADYMALQEFGGTVSGGVGDKAIPTSYSAGQSEGARPRTHVPRKWAWMKRIRLQHTSIGGAKNRKQRNKIAVAQAVRTGNKFVWLDLGRRDGIFRIVGGRRNPRIRMVWDLSRTSVTVPRTPLLGPATDETAQHLPEYYRDALLYQLRRNKIFNY